MTATETILETAQTAVKSLPADASLRDLIDELEAMESIEEGLRDVREGRAVVDAFLAEDPTFARAPLPERYASLARGGDVVVPAGVDGRDGFFIATLVRAA